MFPSVRPDIYLQIINDILTYGLEWPGWLGFIQGVAGSFYNYIPAETRQSQQHRTVEISGGEHSFG